MELLYNNDLREVSGGWSLSAAFLNAAILAGKTIYSFGFVIGSTIRGIVNGIYSFR